MKGEVQGTDHDQARKVLCQEGIVGKVVVELVLREVGVLSESCRPPKSSTGTATE